jgi:hypothetical protein
VVEKAVFAVNVRDGVATGNLKALYHDLKLAVFTRRKRRSASFFPSWATCSSSPTTGPPGTVRPRSVRSTTGGRPTTDSCGSVAGGKNRPDHHPYPGSLSQNGRWRAKERKFHAKAQRRSAKTAKKRTEPQGAQRGTRSPLRSLRLYCALCG